MSEKVKVNAYIDGFNLYHGVDRYRDDSLKWLDVRRLVELFMLDSEELNKVYFYSALPKYYDQVLDEKYRQNGAEKIERHRLYVRALHEYSRIEQRMSNFILKDITLHLNTSYTKDTIRYKKPEEKQSDVKLCVDLVFDAFTSEAEKFYVVSADGDIAAGIEKVTKFSQKKVHSLIPPFKDSYYAVKAACSDLSVIEKHHLLAAQLPDTIITRTGREITRPNKYKS